MELASYIEANKDRLIEQWKVNAVERLAIRLEHSTLLNDLPLFIDELVEALRTDPAEWVAFEGAKTHGQQRMRLGIDIGGLTEEMALVGETVIELACRDGEQFAGDQIVFLMRAVGRGAAISVNAYAAMRDRELADQAAQHFSFIAHEIRNPLHNIRLAITILESCTAETRAALRTRLDRWFDQLARLIDDSLVQARLYGEPNLQPQRIGVRELIDLALEDVETQAMQRGLAVSVEVEPFELDADRKLIVSALTNLLRNAVKFTCDGGRIVVRVRACEERAHFEVEDECCGIPEELLGRLFQPFVQATNSRSGTGLGLMIVKQAAEAHGGSVRVVNRPGDGCLFVMDLPCSQPDSVEDRSG
jgi:signal transduction histidine kinase